MPTQKYRIRILLSFILWIFYCLYLQVWQDFTGSGPERDAFKFYYPSMSLLYAHAKGVGLWQLIQDLSFPQYPWGYLTLSAAFSLAGLGEFCFSNPIALSFVPAFAIAAIVLLESFSIQQAVLLSLLIFTHPLSQVSLKGLSPHSICVFFPFFALLLMQRQSTFGQVIAWILFFFAGGFKHLGLLNLLLIAFAALVVLVLSTSKPKAMSSFLIPLGASICSLIFYEFSGSQEYQGLLQEHLHHFPNFSLSWAVFFLVLLITVASAIIKFRARLEILPCYEIESYVVLTLIYYVYALVSLHSMNQFIPVACALILISLRAFMIRDYSDRLFLLSFSISSLAGCVLFASGVGGTFYVFHFPLLLLLPILVKKVIRFPIALLFLFIVLTNLFAQNSFLKQRYGEPGRQFMEKANEGVWNSFWSWYPSPTMQIQKGFARIMEKVNFQKRRNLAILNADLSVDLRTIALYHRNLFIQAKDVYPIEAAAQEFQERWWEKINKSDFQVVCKDLNESNEFPILIQGLAAGRVLKSREDLNYENFTQYLGVHLFDCWKETGILNSDFAFFDLPKQNPHMRVWVKADMLLKEESQFNPYLKGLLDQKHGLDEN